MLSFDLGDDAVLQHTCVPLTSVSISIEHQGFSKIDTKGFWFTSAFVEKESNNFHVLDEKFGALFWTYRIRKSVIHQVDPKLHVDSGHVSRF